MKKKQDASPFPQLSRREFFKIGSTTFMGFHLLPIIGSLNAWADDGVKARGTAERCIFVFLVGGPPQLDTFDLKEGRWTPEDFGVKKIHPELSMPVGLFPRLTPQLDKVAIVRSG